MLLTESWKKQEKNRHSLVFLLEGFISLLWMNLQRAPGFHYCGYSLRWQYQGAQISSDPQKTTPSFKWTHHLCHCSNRIKRFAFLSSFSNSPHDLCLLSLKCELSEFLFLHTLKDTVPQPFTYFFGGVNFMVRPSSGRVKHRNRTLDRKCLPASGENMHVFSTDLLYWGHAFAPNPSPNQTKPKLIPIPICLFT